MSNTIKFVVEGKQSSLVTMVKLEKHETIEIHSDDEEKDINDMPANAAVKAYIKDIEFSIPDEMTLKELYKTFFYRPYLMLNMVETEGKISTALAEILSMFRSFVRVYDNLSSRNHFALTSLDTPSCPFGLGISKSSMSLIPNSDDDKEGGPCYDPRLSLAWRAVIYTIGYDEALRLNRNLFGKFKFQSQVGPCNRGYYICTCVESRRNDRVIKAINNAIGYECGKKLIGRIVEMVGNDKPCVQLKNTFFAKTPIYGDEDNVLSVSKAYADILWPTSREFFKD